MVLLGTTGVDEPAMLDYREDDESVMVSACREQASRVKIMKV